MRLAWLLVMVACSDDGVRHTPDAPPDQCVDGAPTIDVTTPAAYACHDNYTAKVTLTNNTCSALTVQNVLLSAVVTSGPCQPPGAGTYAGATVGAGETATVLDLTSGPFCCGGSGCPASYQCDETFTFKVVTAAQTYMATKDVHLSLDNCDVICP